MIIPASIFRVIGFINKSDNSLSQEPQDGNLMLVYSDSGKKIILKLTGTKAELTKEDVKEYIDNKVKSVIKQKEIDLVAAEVEDIEEFEDELEDAIDKMKEEGKDKQAIRDFKKEFKQSKAKEIVFNRRNIKEGSILRLAVSFGDKIDKLDFDGESLPVLTSRAIIFDTEGNPTSTGMYYFAQTANQLPVNISPIFNKDNEPLELFQIELSKLATIEHVRHLVGHIERTLVKSIEMNGKAYLNGVNYDYEAIKDKDVFSIVKDINNIAKDRETKEVDEYISKLKELLSAIEEDNSLILNIFIKFNLLLNKNYFKAIEDSPFSKFDQTLVNLNFSKLDPDDKNKLKAILKKKREKMMLGEIKFDMNAIYNTPALKVGEESTSWGFMHDNVQSPSFILSSRDTTILVKELENK